MNGNGLMKNGSENHNRMEVSDSIFRSAPLTPETPPAAAGLRLGDLFTIWEKRKWMIIAIVVALPLIVGIIVSRQPKVYEASASLVIDSFVPQYLGSQFKDVVEIESNWWTAQETLQTELKVLRSYSQAASVAKALCEKKAADGAPLLGKVAAGFGCEDPARAAALLQGLCTIVPLKDSRVVVLTVHHNDPELAMIIANTMAEVYTERNLERRVLQSEGAATWLGDEYTDLNSQLNESERLLIEFKKKNGVVAVHIEDQQNDMSSRHKKLMDELNSVQVKLLALRAQRTQFAQYESGDPLQDVSPGVADSPVLLKLKELYVDQYAKLVELRGKYLEKHPTVMAQEARVQALHADLVRESGLARKSVEAQYQTLARQERELRDALDGTTKDALQLEQRAIEYNRLKRNFDHLSKLSEQVGGRERETALARHLRTNNVRVLDPAIKPTHHISPNLLVAVGSSAAIALILAFGLAFLLELLDSTVKSQDDVERAVGITFLGMIPRMSTSEKFSLPESVPERVAEIARQGSRDLYVLGHSKSAVAECCRAIRTNLLFMTPNRSAKTLLVTSAGPQEGKTTIAANMAITLAQSGQRVVLVDTDMRRPRLHTAFGLPSGGEGISTAIINKTSVEPLLRETGAPNLWLLPCGIIPPNPAELILTERFSEIVTELSQLFDRVIFDSPPIGAVTDASVLARLTDGTVLIAKGGKTSKDALARASRLLLIGGINLLGCVLNDLDISEQDQASYYYYRYGYYAGYGSYGSDRSNPTS